MMHFKILLVMLIFILFQYIPSYQTSIHKNSIPTSMPMGASAPIALGGSGFLIGSTPQPRVDWVEGVNGVAT